MVIRHALDLRLGLGFGSQFVDADQDVPGVRLVNEGRLVVAAFLQQLDDVKAGGTAQHA